MNYLLTLKFDGSGFHGWQRQQNALSVQECVENAVSSLFGSCDHVTGCSRTDAGVHAVGFKCNFVSAKEIPLANVISGMNHFLPSSIAVTDAQTVPEDFNARFDCVSKEYIYRIYNGTVRDPFSVGRAYHYKYRLDEEMLDRQAKDYIGIHDFSSFRAVGSDVATTVRTIFNAGVFRDGDTVCFRVEGNGFMYNMVRIMAGTLIYISEGKIKQGSVPEILASRDRLCAGMTLPPDGLYLNKVNYERF